ncbi:hypothetical protein N321_07280, partial [Antrostomus carolinensis]
FKWIWGPRYSTKPLPHSCCWRESRIPNSSRLTAKPCAVVPDLRQRSPLVIQRWEARVSCQSSMKGSRARAGAEGDGGAFLLSYKKPFW